MVLDLAGIVAKRLVELLLAWNLLCQVELAPNFIRSLIQSHVVATLSKDYLCDAYAIMAIDNAGCDARHRIYDVDVTAHVAPRLTLGTLMTSRRPA